MLIPVAGADDPRLATFRALKGPETDPTTFVVEGEKLLRRLLALRIPLHSLLVSDRWLPRLAELLPADVPAYVADHAVLPAVIGFRFHRGVLARAFRPPPPNLDDLLVRSARLLACPEVADPANFAAMVRSAAALGWDGVLVGPNAPDAFSRRCVRVSMGATLQLPVATVPAPPGGAALACVRRLQAAGFRC